MPQISVVVPLYNKGPFVQRALDSIASQTFTDWETIVVDDGSTDDGPEQVRRYSDDRFRLITQTNAGPGAARNRGITEARGEWVAFLDADDEWLPDYLASAVEKLRSTGAASYTAAYIDSPGERSSETLWRRRGLREGLQRVQADTSPQLLVHMLAFMSPCTTVARKGSLAQWGGFYTKNGCRYGEDAHLWLKFLLNEEVWFDLHPRVRIHNDAASLSKNLAAARPLEPFLADPDALMEVCPRELEALLRRFYSIRAFKTACVLGYWGRWRDADQLRRRFRTEYDSRLPYYWPSMVCSTPLGAWLGRLARTSRGVFNAVVSVNTRFAWLISPH